MGGTGEGGATRTCLMDHACASAEDAPPPKYIRRLRIRKRKQTTHLVSLKRDIRKRSTRSLIPYVRILLYSFVYSTRLLYTIDYKVLAKQLFAVP